MTPLLKSLLESSLQGKNGGFYAEMRGGLPLERMEQWGYLTPSTLLTSRTCEEAHSAEISHAVSPITGEDLYFQVCDCGVVRIDATTLRTWNTRIEKVMEETVVAMNIRGGITPIIPDLLWRLGRKKTREFFYLRAFWNLERRSLVAALRAIPKAVVLTGVERSAQELQYEIPHPCAALETLARLEDDGRFMIDSDILEDLLGEAAEMDVVQKTPSKTHAKRASRAAKIEKLIKEMEQHLRAARAYAQATADQGDIKLLPRPTQGELAKRTGLTEMDVSRCLKDPNAKTFRFLWDGALNMKFLFR